MRQIFLLYSNDSNIPLPNFIYNGYKLLMLNYLHIPHEQSKKTFYDLNQQQKKKKFFTK